MAKQITWRVEERKVADLIDADYNPRRATEEQERDLEASIEEFGAVMPIVINIGKRNNIIIGGHFRTRLYRKRGIETVDVMVPSRELTLAEEQRLNLRLNRNQGSWDIDKLKQMDLTVLLDVGFDDTDLQIFFDDVDVLDDGFNVGAALASIDEAETKPGDRYQMGNHTLVCATPDKDAPILADFIHVQLPQDASKEELAQYSGNKKARIRAYQAAVITEALTSAKPNAHAMVWCRENDIGFVQLALENQKFEPKRVCVWVGSGVEPTGEAFATAFQPAVYARCGDPYINPSYKNVPNILDKGVSAGNQMAQDVLDTMTVWTDRASRDERYKGKPITVYERPLRRATSTLGVVYDCFAGAGEMLIACEMLGRVAYSIQPDPKMCDVIVRRWEELTNKKAKRV